MPNTQESNAESCKGKRGIGRTACKQRPKVVTYRRSGVSEGGWRANPTSNFYHRTVFFLSPNCMQGENPTSQDEIYLVRILMCTCYRHTARMAPYPPSPNTNGNCEITDHYFFGNVTTYEWRANSRSVNSEIIPILLCRTFSC